MRVQIIQLDIDEVRALLARTQTPTKEFADRIGLSVSHTYNILRGGFGISSKVAPRILRVCNEIESEYEKRRQQPQPQAS